MQVLFIHGMGRTPLSGWSLLRKLRLSGMASHSFGYLTAVQNFAQISSRLCSRITSLGADNEYILIGHSLGGVLLRSALAGLPTGARLPSRVFLLGSPTQPGRLAQSLRGNLVYRLATGDCGQLLALEVRMLAVPPVAVPTTSICGDRALALTSRAFCGEPNDGVVAVSETSAAWITETILVPVVHTLLPSSARVAEIILKRIREAGQA
jgi:pimeloyl-ACP methyl ester carboxylesterase